MTENLHVELSFIYLDGVSLQLNKSERVRTAVGHVKETIFIFVLLVDCRQQNSSGRKCVLHKDENSPLGAELDPLTNHINKLPNGQISRDKVFLFINIRNVTSFRLLYNYRYSIRILLSDASRFSQPPFEGVLNFEGAFSHGNNTSASIEI